jgi:hypothetical protein
MAQTLSNVRPDPLWKYTLYRAVAVRQGWDGSEWSDPFSLRRCPRRDYRSDPILLEGKEQRRSVPDPSRRQGSDRDRYQTRNP